MLHILRTHVDRQGQTYEQEELVRQTKSDKFMSVIVVDDVRSIVECLVIL